MAIRKTDTLQDSSSNLVDKFTQENGFVGGTDAAKNLFIFVNSSGINMGAGNYRWFKGSKTRAMTAENVSSTTDNKDTQINMTPITVSVDKSFSGYRPLSNKDQLTTLPNGQIQIPARNMKDINNKIVRRTSMAILQMLHNNAINAGGVNQAVLSKALSAYTGTDGILELTEEIQTSINILRETVSDEQDIELVENSQMAILASTALCSKLRLLKAIVPNPTADAVINGYKSIGTIDGVNVIEISKAAFLNNSFKINGEGDATTTNLADIEYIIAPIGDIGSVAYVSERGPQIMTKDDPNKPTLITNIHYDMNYGGGDLFTGMVVVGYKNGTTAPTTPVVFSNKHLDKNSKSYTEKDFDAEVEKRIKKAQKNIKGENK